MIAMTLRDLRPAHFNWRMEGAVAVVSLARPERKNPLTFESYAELRDTFRALTSAHDIKAVVFASNGGNFSSGGDVHAIRTGTRSTTFTKFPEALSGGSSAKRAPVPPERLSTTPWSVCPP